METDIVNCARCGSRHDGLEFEELDTPCPSDGEAYTHWASCPSNGQPILLEIIETPEASDNIRTFSSDDDPDLDFRPCKKEATVEAVQMDEPFVVETLEGTMQGQAGDYLMKGAASELYPCEANIFEDTYAFVG